MIGSGMIYWKENTAREKLAGHGFSRFETTIVQAIKYRRI